MESGSQEFKKELYGQAWHGDIPYDKKEIVRLEKVGRILNEHADSLQLDRRYEMLDVGCGVGPMRQWCAAERFRITGIELCEGAVEIARKNYDACEIGDVEQDWPFESESFDGLHAGAILEHVANWHAPLNNANRVLKPGGMIVIAVPNLRYWKELRRLIKGRHPHWMTDMEHIHAYTPKFLKTLVTIHGFEVTALEADRVNLPLLPNSRRITRWFAGWGSVMILSAKLVRRVQVEDECQKTKYPNHKDVAIRSIEVLG